MLERLLIKLSFGQPTEWREFSKIYPMVAKDLKQFTDLEIKRRRAIVLGNNSQDAEILERQEAIFARSPYTWDETSSSLLDAFMHGKEILFKMKNLG